MGTSFANARFSKFDRWVKDIPQDVPISSNQGSSELPFQRWFKFKEAYSPILIKEVVESLSYFPENCFDPFGGCGTTAIACQFLGIRPHIVEVNPFLADLAQAKLETYNESELLEHYLWICDVAPKEKVSPKKVLPHAPKTLFQSADSKRWVFSDEVLSAILRYRMAIQKIEDARIRNFFLVTLASIIVPVSNVLVNGKGRRYRTNWAGMQKHARDVDFQFAESFKRALQDIVSFPRRLVDEFQITRGSSITLDSINEDFDLVVFSPPYLNSFDYTDVYNLELWVLGYLDDRSDEKLLRRAALSSNVQISREYKHFAGDSEITRKTIEQLSASRSKLWNQNIPEMIETYFAEYAELTYLLRSATRDNGMMCCVVGDSQYSNVPIPVADIIIEISTQLGFRLVENRRLRNMQTSAQQGMRRELGEHLLKFQPA